MNENPSTGYLKVVTLTSYNTKEENGSDSQFLQEAMPSKQNRTKQKTPTNTQNGPSGNSKKSVGTMVSSYSILYLSALYLFRMNTNRSFKNFKCTKPKNHF